LASAGPNFPQAATGNTNSVGGGTAAAWLNPNNIFANDGSSATSLPGTAITQDLRGGAFGFSIPSTAVIDGILLEVNAFTPVTTNVEAFNTVELEGGGGTSANRATGTLVPTPTTFSFGGSSDLWGTTWTSAQINSSTFVGNVSFRTTGGGPGTIDVDFFRITVFFHSVISDGITLSGTASQVSGAASKINSSISTSATTGFQDIAALTMSSSLSLSNTAGFADVGVDVPGSPSIFLSATPGVTIAGVTVFGVQPITLGNTAGFAETGGVGGSRGITLPVSPGAFFNAAISGTPLLTSDEYTGLVTSEHNQRPNFMAMIAVQVQAYVDNINLLRNFQALFDIDLAAGQQLDMIGVWVGASRNISIPLTGVYFSFNTVGLGFNQGTWLGIGDSTSGLTTLSDDQYRLLLKAKIASNHWDGTVPGAYAIWAIVFQFEPFTILIQDNQDMTMQFTLVGTNIPAVTKALLTNGLIALIPAGVSATYVTP
jgi:hypothetical protein